MSTPPEVRPRYGRIAALTTAVLVTALSGLAGLGALSAGPTAAAEQTARPASYQQTPTPSIPTQTGIPSPGTDVQASGPTLSGGRSADSPAQVPVPTSSGTGRRVVFSEHLQRVWILGGHDQVRRTYLVSGSLTHNLYPGTYAVAARQRHATGIHNSGTMQYFVVFTAGPTGAAIGFHTIPVKNGHPVQTVAQLGTPQSHGCIRQWTPDAVALWHDAPIGTKVVVVA